MPKRFQVEPGYLARIGACWYDYRVALIVVEDETVDLYRRAATVGKAPTLIASCRYPDLDPEVPPAGLCQIEPRERMSLPLSVVEAKTA
jgi:hypothetical protein